MGRPNVEAKRAKRKRAHRAKHAAQRSAKLQRRLARVELEHRAGASGLVLPGQAPELEQLGSLR